MTLVSIHNSRDVWIPAHCFLNVVNTSMKCIIILKSWWCTHLLPIFCGKILILSQWGLLAWNCQPCLHTTLPQSCHEQKETRDWISFLPSALFRKFKAALFIIHPRPSEGGYLSHTEIKISFSQKEKNHLKHFCLTGKYPQPNPSVMPCSSAPHFLRLPRRTISNIERNIRWAILYFLWYLVQYQLGNKCDKLFCRCRQRTRSHFSSLSC